jgi:hypothetical protein
MRDEKIRQNDTTYIITQCSSQCMRDLIQLSSASRSVAQTKELIRASRFSLSQSRKALTEANVIQKRLMDAPLL